MMSLVFDVEFEITVEIISNSWKCVLGLRDWEVKTSTFR